MTLDPDLYEWLAELFPDVVYVVRFYAANDDTFEAAP